MAGGDSWTVPSFLTNEWGKPQTRRRLFPGQLVLGAW